MIECDCGPEEDQQQVDEVESEDQMEYEVAEDAADDDGATETEQEDNDDQEANASASAYDASQDEEQVEESYANSDDDKYQADMDFMTNVISGGLNKKKSTGQSTIPVVATQASRLGNPMQESMDLLHDWRSLAGIK